MAILKLCLNMRKLPLLRSTVVVLSCCHQLLLMYSRLTAVPLVVTLRASNARDEIDLKDTGKDADVDALHILEI